MEKSQTFLKRNWKMILIIAVIVILLVLFIILSGKNVVSPDLRYFPS